MRERGGVWYDGQMNAPFDPSMRCPRCQQLGPQLKICKLQSCIYCDYPVPRGVLTVAARLLPALALPEVLHVHAQPVSAGMSEAVALPERRIAAKEPVGPDVSGDALRADSVAPGGDLSEPWPAGGRVTEAYLADEVGREGGERAGGHGRGSA